MKKGRKTTQIFAKTYTERFRQFEDKVRTSCIFERWNTAALDAAMSAVNFFKKDKASVLGDVVHIPIMRSN